MFVNLDLMLYGDSYDIDMIVDVEGCINFVHTKDIHVMSLCKEENKYVVKIQLKDNDGCVTYTRFKDLADAEQATTRLAKVINDNV